MKFRRRQIETYCTYFTYQLTLFLAVIFMLGMIDDFFDWDIIPYKVQHVIEKLIIPLLGIILGACAALSLLLNFSLLSSGIEFITTKNENATDEKFQLVIFGKKILKVVLIVAGGLALLIYGLNIYDTTRAKMLFNDFKSASVDSSKIVQLSGYLNMLNRNEDFIYKEEKCESVLADDSCLGYSNVQALASVKKILGMMSNGSQRMTFEAYTTFKGQLISISSEGVYIEGIFVGYDEVMQYLGNQKGNEKKEIINGFAVHWNDSYLKSRKVVIDLKAPTDGKLFVKSPE
ncbi:MAG: hypothetical protein ABI723_06675 [Bacteroidia bacterium]